MKISSRVIPGWNNCYANCLYCFSVSATGLNLAINAGSAPRDNLYSPERQRSLGHIDESQRQISSEELDIHRHHLDIHRGKTTGISGPLKICL